MIERTKWRIEIVGEGVRWARDSESAIAYLTGFLIDTLGKRVDVKRDDGQCFLKKTKAEKIIACVYDCPNCSERRK